MAKFIYLGVEDAFDPKGTLAFGVYFPIGVAVDIEDRHAVRKLGNHPHFKPARAEKAAGDEPAGDADKAASGGAKAKAAGKPRNVPPAYRGKPEEARWLAGYDGAVEG